ncbi:MAG: phosphoribosylamine--glycine ligase [Elusimicrobiota bacterium]|jgi:phosphoribosylamine--glycine ligase
MRVLVIGSGAREHALVHALAKSPQVKRLWCAPGNAGIAQEAECVALPADNIRSLLAFAKDNKVDLTMVGPEAPLVDGLVDHFRNEGLRVVGPTKTSARLEGSKSLAKDFMRKYGIPTARYEVIPNLCKGTYQFTHWTGRSVVKADGLAAGKGVKVCQTQVEAKDFLFQIMEKEIFGSAGSTAVIEECLEGEEATIMAFCDGKTLVPMPASQDHKRLLDNDEGPNTGGMGAYAPAPVVSPEMNQQIDELIFKPFMRGIAAEKYDYRGIIYFGLMLTHEGPKVLEFNVRFGDPETQVVLPLLESDLADVLAAVADQRLAETPVRWKKGSTLCVVLASSGYPANYAKGKLIRGLSSALVTGQKVKVYHAGTQATSQGVVTSGGRVLGVTAVAETLEKARKYAYQAVEAIQFDGKIYRKDIGAKALALCRGTR